MLKWKREYAGRYSTACGRFYVGDVWHNDTGTKRVWILYCNDSRYTLERTHPDINNGFAVVDSFNTLADAKHTAGLLAIFKMDTNLKIAN